MDNTTKPKHHQLPGGGYYLASRFFHYFAYFCLFVEAIIIFTGMSVITALIALAIGVTSSLLAGNLMKKSLKVLNDYMDKNGVKS